MSNRALSLLALVVFAFSAGCGGGGGGGELNVGSIQGPISVNEGASVQFSVTASGDTGITYTWTCTPGSAGTLTNASSATCTFTAAAVTADTTATISVTVSSDNHGPEVAQLSITITDVPVVPDTGWAQTWGGTSDDVGQCIAIDASNNIYTVGRFIDTVDFDPGSGTCEYTSNGYYDAYLCRFDPSGNFIWAVTWGGDSNDVPSELVVDGTGDSYVTGSFASTVDFDPGTGTDEHMPIGGTDAYISKFDANGAHLWVRTWGGADWDEPYDMALDSATGNVYVSGSFMGTADFDPDSDVYSLTSEGYIDAFLTKYNSAGEFQWARSWGGSAGDERASCVDIDSSGNIWTGGEFEYLVDFDPSTGGSYSHTAWGKPDAFLSLFDSSGTFVMANAWGGPDAQTHANGIAFNSAGAVFVTGSFEQTVDFGHSRNPADNRTSNGGLDVYVIRFDSSGIYNWVVTWGGKGDDFTSQLAIDNTDAVYVTGDFWNTVDFDPGANFDNHTSLGVWDIFINKLDSAGNHVWTRTLGSTGIENGYFVTCDNSNNVYVTGSFSDTVDFDPGTGTDEHVSNGDADAFLLKYLPDGSW